MKPEVDQFVQMIDDPSDRTFKVLGVNIIKGQAYIINVDDKSDSGFINHDRITLSRSDKLDFI